MVFSLQRVRTMKKELIWSAITSFIVTLLGGADELLSTMVIFIILDMITGVLKALILKDLSSVEMYKGIIKKMTLFLIVILGVRVDLIIMNILGTPITLGTHEFLVRTYFIVFILINEGLSIVENLYKIGVPFPHWVGTVLRAVSSTADGEIPKPLREWLTSKGVKFENPREEPEENKEEPKK